MVTTRRKLIGAESTQETSFRFPQHYHPVKKFGAENDVFEGVSINNNQAYVHHYHHYVIPPKKASEHGQPDRVSNKVMLSN